MVMFQKNGNPFSCNLISLLRISGGPIQIRGIDTASQSIIFRKKPCSRSAGELIVSIQQRPRTIFEGERMELGKSGLFLQADRAQRTEKPGMRIVWQMVSFELQDRKETPFPPGIREVRGHAVGKIQGEARSGTGDQGGHARLALRDL